MAEQSSLENRGHTVLWIALAAALSPLLVDLAAHVVGNRWARGAAIFPLLLAYCAWRDPSPRTPSRDGLVLLVLGVAVAFVDVGGGMPRVGRPGIVLAVLGLARMTGRPSLRCALLALWMIPFPTQIIEALAPGLDAVVANLAAHFATALGVASRVDASHVVALRLIVPAGRLELFPGDGGLALAWTFAGLGWFVVVRREAPLAEAARIVVRWMMTAIALQAVTLALACAVALFGRPALGRALLDHFLLVATLLGLALASRFQVGFQGRPAIACGVHPAASAGA